MLVLGRKENESVHIGNNVVVRLQRHRKGWALAIEAPKDIPVHRSEVVDKIIESGRKLPEVAAVVEK
jgi:carbon storage regulator CsrA